MTAKRLAQIMESEYMRGYRAGRSEGYEAGHEETGLPTLLTGIALGALCWWGAQKLYAFASSLPWFT
jgi:hypothetical protein